MLKKAAKYILFGITATVFVIGLAQYQNCAPATGQTSAFNLGASSTPLTITSISLPSNSYQPGAAMTATAQVTNASNSSDPINCTWTVVGSGNAQVESFGTQSAQSGTCTLTSGFAPQQAGSYILTLTAVDIVSNQSATNSMSFTSGSACVPNGQFCGSAYNANYACGGSPPTPPASCMGTSCCSGHGGVFNSVQQSGTYCTFNYACSP